MNTRSALIFILSSLAISLCVMGIVILIEKSTGLKLTDNSYVSIWIISLLYWFIGALTSLAISRWVAKKSMNIELYSPENISWGYNERMSKFYSLIERISIENNIKTPEFWVYEALSANAFATGPTKNRSLVAVSSKLLDTMTDNEVEWVIAHEMSHILNGDMVGMTLLSGLMNAFVIFWARIITIAIDNFTDNKLWPLLGWIIQIIISILLTIPAVIVINYYSRIREYKADSWAGNLVWREKMIAALNKLKELQRLAEWQEGNEKYWLLSISWENKKDSLFSTHPSLENRIARLKEAY